MAFLSAKPVGGLSYLDLVGMAAVKIVEEPILAKTPIGDATIVSGIAKLAIGYGAHKFLGGGLLGNSVAGGFTLDGVEDLSLVAMNMLTGGGKKEAAW
jgi:hypothetical protein